MTNATSRAPVAVQIVALLALYALATLVAALVFVALMRAGVFGFLWVMF